MRDVHFQTLDLNLLRVFDALAEERNVTRAGERLGLTQSAVSHALNRLRYALEDELFVRGPEGMSPTPRAVEIWPELKRGLMQLQHALTTTDFVPAESDRTFRISASAYIGEVLLPRVIARVRGEAPQVQMQVRSLGPNAAETLDTGQVDLVIGFFGRISEVFVRETLFEERLVWAVRADHPSVDGEVSIKDLQKLPLAIIAPGERTSGGGGARLLEPRMLWEELTADQNPLGRGARQRLKVGIDNVHAAMAIAASSDLATLVPYRMARLYCEPMGLKLVDPPGSSPKAVLESVCRADQHNHPAISWLRNLLREEARKA
jgi:DNA-binding transcriptional LysR family regulator